MITFRLVHSVPNPRVSLGWTSFGIGTLTGGFTQLTLLSSELAGVGGFTPAVSAEGNLVSSLAGVGDLTALLVVYNPSGDFGDSRNSALFALLEDI